MYVACGFNVCLGVREILYKLTRAQYLDRRGDLDHQELAREPQEPEAASVSVVNHPAIAEQIVNARQKERVAAILAGTDAAGAGAGVEEALNCWEEGAHEAETLEALAEFGD